MRLLFTILACMAYFSLPLFGQISPQSGAVLNYTQVLFEYPARPNAHLYTLKIWKGNIDLAEKQDTLIQNDPSTVSIVKGLAFGTTYKWQYIAKNDKGVIVFTSRIFQFNIAQKMRVNSNRDDKRDGERDDKRDGENGDFTYNLKKNIGFSGYVLNDLTKQMIDEKGDIQWMLPEVEIAGTKIKSIRDLRMTEAGTFTCIKEDGIGYELDLQGNVLWKTPKDICCPDDTAYYYHHDFRRLSNGNYLILNQDKRNVEIPNVDTTEWAKKEGVKIIKGKAYTNIPYGTIVEFDPQGKIVWQWNSATFFIEQAKQGRKISDTHLNAFYMDKNGRDIYLGFRHWSLILKIDKQTGKVSDYCYGVEATGEPLFRFQHSIEKTEDGNLLIFNNDSTQADNIVSSVVVVSDKEKGKWKKVQAFSCKIDDLDNGKSSRFGSADVLPNGNILIGMGGQGRMVVVNPHKNGEIVWDMSINAHSTPLFYRSHYVSGLYPCYFSIEKQANALKIVNEGEKEDSYVIHFKGANGEILKTLTSPVIAPNQSHNIPFVKNATEAEVTAKANARLVRNIKI